MVTGTATVTKMWKGFTAMVSKVQALTKKEVLVGIPQEEAQRPGGDMVNNAELLYVHTHGVRAPAMRAEMQKNIDAPPMPVRRAPCLNLLSGTARMQLANRSQGRTVLRCTET